METASAIGHARSEERYFGPRSVESFQGCVLTGSLKLHLANRPLTFEPVDVSRPGLTGEGMGEDGLGLC